MDREEFVSPKGQWKRFANEMVSMAKVRQQYQAAREWYARQNRKFQVSLFHSVLCIGRQKESGSCCVYSLFPSERI